MPTTQRKVLINTMLTALKIFSKYFWYAILGKVYAKQKQPVAVKRALPSKVESML